jgi:type III pantothenate kinase
VLLAIDVGNTRTHIGVFGGDRLIGDWHAATNDRATADDLAANITGVAGREGLDFDAIGIASVVPVVTQQLESMARRVFGVPAHAIEGSSELGLRVATDDPAQVGADRLANALAARNIAGRANAIVVDMGTATKVDAMSADGRFLGGAIAPGVTPAVGTLVDSAAGLPAPSGRPISSVGGTTRGAVNSGAVLGAAAMVDALVARVAAELDGAALVVATGGAAPLVAEHVSQIDVVEPALTLIGIRLAMS